MQHWFGVACATEGQSRSIMYSTQHAGARANTTADARAASQRKSYERLAGKQTWRGICGQIVANAQAARDAEARDAEAHVIHEGRMAW